jgi:LysM repeat protein
MALQSQTLRAGSGPRSSVALGKTARKGGRGKMIGAALLLAAVGGASIYSLRHHAAPDLGPQSAKAEPAPAIVPEKTVAAAPAPAITPAPAPAKPAYDVLEMAPRPRVGGSATPATKPDTLASPRPNFAVDPAAAPGTSPATPAPSTTPAATPVITSTPAAAVTTTETPKPASTPPATASTAPAVRDPLAGGPAPTGSPSAPSSAPAQPAPASAATSGGPLPAELAALDQLADRALADKKPLEARAQLNKIVTDARLSDAQRETYRRKMWDLNKDLVFSPAATPGDPMVQTYTVEKGDNVIKISRKLNTVTEASLIQRVNGINPSSLRVGQTLKVVRGPFHAVVSKSAFRMDLYWGPSVAPSAVGTSNLGAGAEPGWVYIRSFPVGLGEKGATPLGAFTLRERSKLVNPPWVNPRTGEKFDKDDPKNPIGERWMGLVGLDDKSKAFNSYGIHGTVVPESIGQEMSMGCVRMRAEDVEIVYELLMERVSVVKIIP